MNDVTAAEGDLIVRREGALGVIRLNRPKAINALSLEMSEGVDAALDRFEHDPDIAVVLLVDFSGIIQHVRALAPK